MLYTFASIRAGIPQRIGGVSSGQGSVEGAAVPSGEVTKDRTTRAPRPRTDGPGPSRARDLGELQQAVERGVREWARKGQLSTIVTAFSKAGKVRIWGSLLRPGWAGVGPA